MAQSIDRVPLPAPSLPSGSFGILEEWAEGLAALSAQAERAVREHRRWIDAYFEACAEAQLR